MCARRLHALPMPGDGLRWPPADDGSPAAYCPPPSIPTTAASQRAITAVIGDVFRVSWDMASACRRATATAPDPKNGGPALSDHRGHEGWTVALTVSRFTHLNRAVLRRLALSITQSVHLARHDRQGRTCRTGWMYTRTCLAAKHHSTTNNYDEQQRCRREERRRRWHQQQQGPSLISQARHPYIGDPLPVALSRKKSAWPFGRIVDVLRKKGNFKKNRIKDDSQGKS